VSAYLSSPAACVGSSAMSSYFDLKTCVVVYDGCRAEGR
jgi:hypothetical protein